ncbi:MAG: twin-arginine translocation signal domain-containing protein [Adlercreutzia equolifaciens]
MSKTNLTRRSFVKVSALAGAAAAVGASMAGCMQEAAPEEELAGTGEVGVSSTEGLTKMRTSCHGCIQMCPAIAYLKDGVVVRLEGDPEAPVSAAASASRA